MEWAIFLATLEAILEATLVQDNPPSCRPCQPQKGDQQNFIGWNMSISMATHHYRFSEMMQDLRKILDFTALVILMTQNMSLENIFL